MGKVEWQINVFYSLIWQKALKGAGAEWLAVVCLNGCVHTACDEAADENFVQQRIDLHANQTIIQNKRICSFQLMERNYLTLNNSVNIATL